MKKAKIPPTVRKGDGPVTAYCRANFRQYNALELMRAGDAYREFVQSGGKMMVTLAGAMSTAELGKSLAQMIRAGHVALISCTGANLEEDVFNLVGHFDYKPLPDYRDLQPEEEQQLADDGTPRVTTVALPEEQAVTPVTDALFMRWQAADRAGRSAFPHQYFFELLRDGDVAHLYQIPVEDSWLYAAMERDLPMVVPGWEDSTCGNAFAAACIGGAIRHTTTVKSGVDYMLALAAWYAQESPGSRMGFFQIGGGIAGDFPICVIPMLHLELGRDDLPKLEYFCQITDATTSYGGYSGALPNEKISWGKIAKDAETFVIESDATICAPLLFANVLGL